LGNQINNEAITQTINQLIKDRKPQNVQHLVNLVKEKAAIPEQEIIEHILLLLSQGKITLEESSVPIRPKLSTFLKTKEAYWYWITLVVAISATLAVFAIPEDVYPLVYVRIVLGLIFVLGSPGYSLVKTLFPEEPPFRASSKNLNSIERLALSIGMSLALVPMIGLLLNYTSWGLSLISIVLTLLVLTLIFATVGIAREYKSQIEEST
jgi:hypothetical protein